MSFFSNIKIDENNISFELNNNDQIRLALANSIRRIIISEIPIYCIDIDSIQFINNSSMLHNAILAKRLSLIPLNYSTLDNIDINEVSVSLNIDNNTSHLISILTKDFIFKYNDQPLENVLVNEDILFAKLQPNQSLIFETKINKNNAYLGGSYYSPVCKSVLTFKRDDDKLKEIAKDYEQNKIPITADEKVYYTKDAETYINIEGDKYYLKNKKNEPSIYLFDIEGNGVIDNKSLVLLTLNVLKEKLVSISNAITQDITDKIQIQRSEKLFTSFNFTIFEEDHTIGNLINSYLLEHPLVQYTGYIVPHPSIKKVVITTQLNNDNDIDGNKKVFMEVLNRISELVDKLVEEWTIGKEATGKKPSTKKIKIVSKK